MKIMTNENKTLDQLARIADALESIVQRLDALEELPETLQRINDCVGEYPPSKFSPPGTSGASFIRIGGTVYGE